VETEIINLITNLGVAGIFIWMYWRERSRCQVIRDEHIRDLRYIASIKHDRPADAWNGSGPGDPDRDEKNA
jgi:hypothetical protein